MNKNIIIGSIFAVIVIVGLLGFFYWKAHQALAITSFDECVSAGYPVMESYPEQCRANGMIFVREIDLNEEAVRNVLTTFGKKLQFVSVMAPTNTAALAIGDNYSSLVSQTLLANWESDPSKAPGRLTSSPWPDHMEITSVTAVDSSVYRAQGNIVELTSRELSNGGIANEYPVSATVEEQGGNWVITSWEGGPSER